MLSDQLGVGFSQQLAPGRVIAEGDLPVTDIITEPTDVEDALQAYINLRDKPSEYSALAFKW